MIKLLLTGAIALLAMTSAKAKDQISYRIAQSSMCPTAIQNAETCLRNWRSMGGGSDGQAGSFKQCAQVYCQAITAAGCRKPSACTAVE